MGIHAGKIDCRTVLFLTHIRLLFPNPNCRLIRSLTPTPMGLGVRRFFPFPPLTYLALQCAQRQLLTPIGLSSLIFVEIRILRHKRVLRKCRPGRRRTANRNKKISYEDKRGSRKSVERVGPAPLTYAEQVVLIDITQRSLPIHQQWIPAFVLFSFSCFHVYKFCSCFVNLYISEQGRAVQINKNSCFVSELIDVCRNFCFDTT